MGRVGHDLQFAEYIVPSAHELTHPVALLVFPPLTLAAFLSDRRSRDVLLREGCFNAAVMNWEQLVVPVRWVRALETLDAIVAPSAFTRDTFEKALPTVPVVGTKMAQTTERHSARSEAFWVASG
ncbi:MAG TPA: hypothetical protein VJX92_21630 [Methylomirabilota bacterium]|nr:hypothetical protein [Methylomirabilota bacterium]